MEKTNLKYRAKVTHIGELVTEFIDAGILVFFGEQAPQELRDFSIIHDGKELKADLEKGDVLYLDHVPYEILSIGPVANQNFANLGHLVVKFNGALEPEMPGDVTVANQKPHDVKIGSVIEIVSGQAPEEQGG